MTSKDINVKPHSKDITQTDEYKNWAKLNNNANVKLKNDKNYDDRVRKNKDSNAKLQHIKCKKSLRMLKYIYNIKEENSKNIAKFF